MGLTRLNASGAGDGTQEVTDCETPSPSPPPSPPGERAETAAVVAAEIAAFGKAALEEALLGARDEVRAVCSAGGWPHQAGLALRVALGRETTYLESGER